ncbi:MAG: cytochrome P450 [Ardenticatenaceae bacterium]|nr:cytochrome P450 [Ardenticatenaceae bacterium]
MCAFFISERLRRISRPPGPQGNVLLGNLLPIQRDPLGFLLNSADEFGDTQYYQVGFWTVYRFTRPEHIQHILQDNHRNYDKSTIDYDILRRISGRGLISNQGESWLRQRRLMQPLFHRKRIAALSDLMVESTENVRRRWEQAAASGSVVDVSEDMTELTLDIVSRALFTFDIGQEGQEFSRSFSYVNSFFGSLDTVFAIAPWMPTPKIRRYHREMAKINQMIFAIIDQRRLRPQEGDRVDLLTLLLEARDEESGEGMSDQQIRDEVITLLIAGHETTANLMAWTWLLLAQNPAARAQLEEEVDRVLNGRLPGMDDIPNLPVAERILKEALRLYPPAWFISRNAIGDDEIGGYSIPAGSLVSASVFLAHRHPEFWPDPLKFDPDRFLPEREKNRPRYAYLPFGGGPRLCIGNTFAMVEATLILTTLVQRLRLELIPGRPVEPEPLITLNMKDHLVARVTTRQ